MFPFDSLKVVSREMAPGTGEGVALGEDWPVTFDGFVGRVQIHKMTPCPSMGPPHFPVLPSWVRLVQTERSVLKSCVRGQFGAHTKFWIFCFQFDVKFGRQV